VSLINVNNNHNYTGTSPDGLQKTTSTLNSAVNILLMHGEGSRFKERTKSYLSTSPPEGVPSPNLNQQQTSKTTASKHMSHVKGKHNFKFKEGAHFTLNHTE